MDSVRLEIWAPSNPLMRTLREAVRDEGRRVFSGMLEHNPDARFLDVGCSIGDLTRGLASSIGTNHVYGLDCKAYNPSGINFVIGDLNRSLPFKAGTFDVVTASQVLEHLVDPLTFLKELSRIIKSGGYAVLSTPNLAAWHNVVSLIWGTQPHVMDPSWDHTKMWTSKSLIRYLKGHFNVEKVVGIGFYPLPIPLARLACKLDPYHAVDIVVKVRK